MQLNSKLKKIQGLFKDLHRNLRTFQGKMEFKDFSRTSPKIQGLLKTVRTLSLFCPNPPGMSTAPPTLPPASTHKLTQPLRVRTLYQVLHELHAIKIPFHHCNDERIFAND